MNQIKNIDLFELDRILEDIGKIYAAPSATVWFKVIRTTLQKKNIMKRLLSL